MSPISNETMGIIGHVSEVSTIEEAMRKRYAELATFDCDFLENIIKTMDDDCTLSTPENPRFPIADRLYSDFTKLYTQRILNNAVVESNLDEKTVFRDTLPTIDDVYSRIEMIRRTRLKVHPAEAIILDSLGSRVPVPNCYRDRTESSKRSYRTDIGSEDWKRYFRDQSRYGRR